MEISSDDEASQEKDVSKHSKTVGTITSIGNVNVYNVCMNKTCFKKKLDKDNRCPSCKSKYVAGYTELGYNLKLGLKMATNFAQMTAFNDVVEKLLRKIGKENPPTGADALEEVIFSALPFEITFSFSSTNIIENIF